MEVVLEQENQQLVFLVVQQVEEEIVQVQQILLVVITEVKEDLVEVDTQQDVLVVQEILMVMKPLMVHMVVLQTHLMAKVEQVVLFG